MTDDDTYDPRVWIRNDTTGERTPVAREEVKGIDEFIRALNVETELPPEFRLQGWQGSDGDHPPDRGRPAYRVVFKTIRLASTKPVAIVSPNCRVLLANDRVSWGEPRFGRALPWRRPERHLLPDWGRLFYEPLRYVREEDNNVLMDAHEETTPPMNYIEVIYVLGEHDVDSEHFEKIDAARAAVAPLLASIDLAFGPRLLGLRITEEIGEVFDDWHWNRRLDGPTVALEAQARLEYLDGDHVLAQIGSIFDANAGRSEEDRARLRIASQWYWRADRETDPVQAFIAYWLTIESLEMPNPNINPVKRVVRDLIGGEARPVSEAIGRLHGLRSKLVHGKASIATPAQLELAKVVALALLERQLLGLISPERRKALSDAVDNATSQQTWP